MVVDADVDIRTDDTLF